MGSQVPDAVYFLLPAVGGHELHVHPLPAHLAGHGRDGAVRHERVVRVPAVVGDPPRAVRGRPGECPPAPGRASASALVPELDEGLVCVQIVAVILCDTGIALLAYMDGITGSPTLGGVVLAASAAAGSAVYKVRPSAPSAIPHFLKQCTAKIFL